MRRRKIKARIIARTLELTDEQLAISIAYRRELAEKTTTKESTRARHREYLEAYEAERARRARGERLLNGRLVR